MEANDEITLLIIVGSVALLGLAYGLTRVMAAAYFAAKFRYNEQLLMRMKEEEVRYGKQTR